MALIKLYYHEPPDNTAKIMTVSVKITVDQLCWNEVNKFVRNKVARAGEIPVTRLIDYIEKTNEKAPQHYDI